MNSKGCKENTNSITEIDFVMKPPSLSFHLTYKCQEIYFSHKCTLHIIQNMNIKEWDSICMVLYNL